MELGVGFNTPGIIRYPFESLACDFAEVRLLRVNLNEPHVPARLGERALGLCNNIGTVLADSCSAWKK